MAKKSSLKKRKQTKVHKVMSEFKDKELNIGKSKKKVRKRSQAIAIALSEARKIGKKNPSTPNPSTLKLRRD